MSRILAVVAIITLAGDIAQAAQTTGTIAGLELDGAGNVSFLLTGAPQLCTNGHQINQRVAFVRGVRGVTPDGLKAIYSTVLAVFLAGKHVTVYTDDSVQTSGWGCTGYALDVSP